MTIEKMLLSITAGSESWERLGNFEKKEVLWNCDLTYHICLRDAESDLKTLFSRTNEDDHILDVHETSQRCHAMRSGIALQAWQQGMLLVKQSDDTEISKRLLRSTD